jgi:hypothetical protein
MKLSGKTFISAAVIGLIACAPVRKNTSSTQSLDNLAATDQKGYTTNHCGASYKSESDVPKSVRARANRITAMDSDLRLAALNALAHVPPALAKPFFAQGGTIELLPNSAETCRVSPLTAKERSYIKEASAQVDSCWISSDKTKKPVIVLPADEKKIRHNLLRILVYFYNEYLVARLDAASVNKSRYEDIRQALSGYKREKLNLMEAFLEDAAIFNLNASKKLWDLRSAGESRFANIVLAEAIDSYYCSASTADKFSRNFTRTWRAFTRNEKGPSFSDQLGKQAFKK